MKSRQTTIRKTTNKGIRCNNRILVDKRGIFIRQAFLADKKNTIKLIEAGAVPVRRFGNKFYLICNVAFKHDTFKEIVEFVNG